MRLPELRGALTAREVVVWDTAYSAAYVQLILRGEPDVDPHGAAVATAEIVADAAVEGHRDLVEAAPPILSP